MTAGTFISIAGTCGATAVISAIRAEDQARFSSLEGRMARLGDQNVPHRFICRAGLSYVSPLLHRPCNTHRTQLSPYSNPFAVAIVAKMPRGVFVAAIPRGGAMTLHAPAIWCSSFHAYSLCGRSSAFL